MPKGTYEFIASANPAGSATAMLSNIPQTYTDLVLFMCLGNQQVGAAYAAVDMRFNSDTAGNYGGVTMYNFGGNYTPQAAAGPSSTIGTRVSTLESAGLATSQVDILNYSSTTTSKPVILRCGQGDWEALRYDAQQGVWLNTSALTTITFTTAVSFKTGSYIALYGIKGE